MPTPKNMTGTMPVKGPKTPNKPEPLPKPTPPAVPVKVVNSAVATLPKSNVAIAIPGFLQQSQMPETSDRQTGGYVGFGSSQSGKWGQMQAAGLQEGQPFLFHQQQFIPLDTLEFFLCMGTSFQTMMAGKKGDFVYITRDLNERMEPRVVQGNMCKLDPHYVVLLLVRMGDALIPIKGDFRGTKSGGIENAIRAVEAAADANWLKLSEQHRATAAFPQPWGRVYHSISTKRQISKSNGNPYFTADCTSTPASVSQMQILVEQLEDESFANALTEAHENYNGRVSFLDSTAEELRNPTQKGGKPF